MLYVIDTSEARKINWAAKDAERIVQNVANLINTIQYEVAYDRVMGINPQIFDRPANEAASLYVAEVYRLISDYEPRAEIKEVRPIGVNSDGDLDFRVVIEI